jgi:hypothetical protein
MVRIFGPILTNALARKKSTPNKASYAKVFFVYRKKCIQEKGKKEKEAWIYVSVKLETEVLGLLLKTDNVVWVLVPVSQDTGGNKPKF